MSGVIRKVMNKDFSCALIGLAKENRFCDPI